MKSKKRDVSTWHKINVTELQAFLSLLIAMSLHRIPWLWDYWSENLVLGVPAFAAIMPRNRFFEILGYIHLANNERMPQHGTEGFDKLYKV